MHERKFGDALAIDQLNNAINPSGGSGGFEINDFRPPPRYRRRYPTEIQSCRC